MLHFTIEIEINGSMEVVAIYEGDFEGRSACCKDWSARFDNGEIVKMRIVMI